MGILPFFTFLRSPVYILIALFAYLLLAYVLSSSQTDRISIFVLFFFIEFWGGTIGSIVGENQHRMLTWTLPHFRKRLLIWSAIVGLFSIIAWTAALTFAPLNASWSTILLMNLGLYCIGFAFSGGWSFGIQHLRLVSMCRTFIVFLGLALAYLWQEVLAFGEQQKLGLALIAFAIAIGAYYFAFNQTTFRRKPFFFVLPLRLTLFPQTREIWQKKKMMMQKVSTRLWHLDHIGSDIFNWLRASQYENSGGKLWQWLLPGFIAALVMVFYFVSTMTHIFGLWDRSPYDFETVLKTIYHMSFYFDQLDPKIAINISLSAFVGIWVYMTYIWSHPFFLKRGYVYPLSRTQRMWIQYCGLLVQNISFFAASILVLGVLGILAGAKIGFVSEGDISLRILCVFGWAVVLWPMFQWLQVKYHLYEFPRTRRQMWGVAFLILGMILACGIAGFAALMRGLYPDLALTYEAPILFVCIMLLQWFLLGRLKRYYAIQDLV